MEILKLFYTAKFITNHNLSNRSVCLDYCDKEESSLGLIWKQLNSQLQLIRLHSYYVIDIENFYLDFFLEEPYKCELTVILYHYICSIIQGYRNGEEII